MTAVATKRPSGRTHIEVKAQEGPQSVFVQHPADIVIYGGSAFSGKTRGLLMIPLMFRDVGEVAAVIFRRETPRIRAPGGLWDEASGLYPYFGAVGKEGVLEYDFPSGFRVKFSHLERDGDVHNWDGPQVPILGYDQLEEFTRYQFFYMLSRNRDPSGRTRPFVRATCNPDAGSWLAEFIAWWIDPTDGYAILERSGVMRWMVRQGDEVIWADTREGLLELGHGDPALAIEDPAQPWMSVTYIPGTIYDNKIGMSKDPAYLGKLKNLDLVERERLLGDAKRGGNWKIKAAAGLLFQRRWLKNALQAEPVDVEWARGWDLAGTPKTSTNDPDWTVGVRLGRYRNTGRYVIGHVTRLRATPQTVEEEVKARADTDPPGTRVEIAQDPGQAGKAQVQALTLKLAGHSVRGGPETGDKETRFRPFSAQAEAGNVDYVVGPWNDAYFSCLENFPDGAHDDDVDATSRAFQAFHGTHTGFLEFARRQAAARAEAIVRHQAAVAAQGPGGRDVAGDVADMGAEPGGNMPASSTPEAPPAEAGRPAGSRIVSANLTAEQAATRPNSFQRSAPPAGPKPQSVAERDATPKDRPW